MTPDAAHPQPTYPAEDARLQPVRTQMLAAASAYHNFRLTAADAKSASLMAIAGVGIGFIVQRTAMSADTFADALAALLRHPSLIALFAALAVAMLAQRAVRVKGEDWTSKLVAGAPPEAVADDFLGLDARQLFASWIASQDVLIRIAQRKYRYVNSAMWLLLLGLALAVAGA
jgi:hypothetical protein